MFSWISSLVLINNVMNDFGYTFFIVFLALLWRPGFKITSYSVFFTEGEGKEEPLTGELIKYYIAFHPETSSTKKACRDSFGLNTDA